MEPSSPTDPYTPPQASIRPLPGPQSAGGPVTRCTQCGLAARHPRVPFRRNGFGCRDLALLLLTGILLYVLWSGQRKQPFTCSGCGELFYARTPGARVCLVLLCCLVAAIVGTLFLPSR